jgi:deoxyadenosine/deoxycytidine kinase
MFIRGGEDVKGYPVIYIDGTVGVGKTTLLQILEQEGFSVVPEPFLDNPLLDKFYQDKKRYSFASQVFFLNKKFGLIKAASKLPNRIIDRSLYGDYIFAKMLRDSGDMSKEEFEIYQELFNHILHYAPAPKLVVYLDISLEEAIKRIRKRGRPSEQNVDHGYWADLNRRYKEAFAAYNDSPLLTINVDHLDFEHNVDDRKYVIETIREKLASIELSVRR